MNNIKQVYLGLSIFLISVFSLCVSAHEDGASHQGSSATYLGNEGVLISSPIGKVLFDPFFHRLWVLSACSSMDPRGHF